MNESIKKHQNLIIYLLLAAVTFITYTQVLCNKFTNFDDSSYIVKNFHVNTGLTLNNIKWAFNLTNYEAANWHPITWLSHMLDCQLFGANPAFHHLTNLLLHIANTLLLFALLKMMTNKIWPSAFVAALFALHPVHVESVAWASERKDVLSTLFWMLTTISYVRYVKKSSKGWYLSSIILFALGLMAKPMLVTLPFVLLLLDYWPLNRFKNFAADKKRIVWLIVEKIPLFLLTAASCTITFIAQKTQGAVANFEELPFPLRISNSIVSYIKYILKILWPENLALYYPYQDQYPIWQTALYLSILLGISFLIIRLATNRKYLLTGWFWYLGTLVPVIGLLQVGAQALADRYTYIPSIGLFIIISWLAEEFSAKLPRPKITLWTSSLLILSVLSILTNFQLTYWRNGTSIFEHTVKVTKNNWLIHFALGGAYGTREQYQKALEAFQKSLEIKPDYAPTYCNIGVLYGKLQNYDKAIELCEKALEIKPEYADAYSTIGGAYLSMGQYDKAIEYCKKALEIKPGLADAHYNLGITYNKMGKFHQAIESLKLAIKYRENKYDPYINLGAIYGKVGMHKEALEYFEKASLIKPKSAELFYNMGVAYSNLGLQTQAIESCKKALKLKPDYAEAHYTLGSIYAQLGRYEEAIAALRESLKIQPNHANAYFNLGCALGRLNRPQEAIAAFKQVINIKPDYVTAYLNLGLAYFNIGDKKSAMEQYTILKQMNPALAEQFLTAINSTGQKDNPPIPSKP